MSREMKDSRIPWISGIPQTWQQLPIRYLFDEVREKNSLGKEKKALKFTYGTIIPKTDFDADEEEYVANTILNYTIVDPGVIMINCLNLNFDFVSQRIGLVKDKGVITSAYLAIKSKDENVVYPPFANYQLKSFDNVKAFHNMGTGVRKTLDFAELGKKYFILPPISEQHRIADFLDSKCSQIDEISKRIQEEINTLEEYKKSVITEAVTKGLDPNAELKDCGIEWAEKVPKHWRVMPNKYVMAKIKVVPPVYQGEDILSLTMNGVIVRDLDAGGKMPSSFNGYQKLKPGNLLMCLFDYDVTPRCIGLIKNEGVTSPAYSQFVMKNDNNASYYYYYYLMIDFTKELLHLAKNLRHSFTEEQLGVIDTPVPPIEEQIAISDYLDKKCEEIEEAISVKRQQLSTLEEYKKSLIYEYVTGKKEVPDANA